jgi:hypothetical protein
MKDGMISKEKVDSETWDSAAIHLIKSHIKDNIVVCKILNMNTVNGVYRVMMYKQKTMDETVSYSNK